MGIIYKANCPCGFEQFKLLQGHGLNGFDYELEIFQCLDCHSLVNLELHRHVDSLFEPVSCPECQGRLQRLDGQPDRGQHPCPECHGTQLQMSVVRVWD